MTAKKSTLIPVRAVRDRMIAPNKLAEKVA